MRVVIQRVSESAVHIDKRLHANIGSGVLVLLGIEVDDAESDADWLCGKLSRLRIFNDAEGTMNRTIQEEQGEFLVISQFTLHASTKKGNRPSWTDGSGRAVPHRFLVAANPRRIRRFPAAGSRVFATLNHYALRSLDSYLVKNDRGDVNRENRAFDDTYWRERNDPAWEDASIQRYLPALNAQMDKLKAQGNIGALHDACVAAHIARRDALLEQPEYREMQQQLRSASKLPPQEEAMLRELGLLEDAP